MRTRERAVHLSRYAPKLDAMVRALIRFIECALIGSCVYNYVLYELLNRGQGGHGDEQLIRSALLFFTVLVIALIFSAVGSRGRSFVQTLRVLSFEVLFPIVTTLLLTILLKGSSLTTFKGHFCSDNMKQRYPSSMLPCNCGEFCGE